MERMSPLDAAFVELEDEDPHSGLHVASVGIFEGPPPPHGEFVTAYAGRLPLVPRYRQKMRRVPFGLATPVWVDDSDFEITYHVRRTAVPSPGGEAELRPLVSRVLSSRLDRDRPLWETWVIEGLENDAWALVSKVHHCLVDGVSGTNLLTVMLDVAPEPAPPPPDEWVPAKEPSDLRLVADALAHHVREPVDLARAAVGAVRRPADTTRRALTTARGLLGYARAVVPTSVSSLSGPLGRPRDHVWARASLADVAVVRHRFGVTVNDVVLAAITSGFRELMLGRGERPGSRSIRSLVPVSVRRPGEEGIYDNRVSAMLAELPVDVDDAVERLREVRHRLVRLKLSGEAPAGETVTSLARYAPYELLAVGLRTAFRFPQHYLTTVTTNVPGPPFPLSACGRRMIEAFPYVPIADRVRIGVAIFSYCGNLTFGITGDHASSPDLEVLAAGVEDGLAELVKLAEQSD